jgi:hypothetical protein
VGQVSDRRIRDASLTPSSFSSGVIGISLDSANVSDDQDGEPEI